MLRRALLALGASACAPLGRAQGLARPIPPDPLPAGSRLEALGGLVLDDAGLGFGGLSGLHLSPELQVTAIGDLAQWMTARLVLRDGRPAGLEGLRTGPLRDGSGQPLARGHASDSESLARLPDGTWLVGFERWHRIRAYARLDAPGTYVEAPPGLELAPGNGGLESLTVLADGRWLAMTEGLSSAPAAFRGWIGTPGRWQPFHYRPADNLLPVDAAALPEGGALVLERGFSLISGFHARLVRLSPAQLAGIGPGTVLEGEELLRTPALPAENFEGVSAARVGGRTLVALVSDDNENLLQRTLLLLFALADD